MLPTLGTNPGSQDCTIILYWPFNQTTGRDKDQLPIISPVLAEVINCFCRSSPGCVPADNYPAQRYSRSGSICSLFFAVAYKIFTSFRMHATLAFPWFIPSESLRW